MQSYDKSPDLKILTPKQSLELERALEDGFAVYGHMMPGISHSLAGIVNEPFFGAHATSGGHSDATVPDFVDHLRKEGLSEQEILDEVEMYLDENVSDDAPHWRETNPFNFRVAPLRKFFEDLFFESNGYFERPGPDESELNFRGLVLMFTPFSRTWFEVQIISELDALIEASEAIKKDGLGNGIFMWMIVGSAGKAGRLIENYRWRFSYGADAMRGRVSISSARAGGIARRAALASRTSAVLDAMRTHLDGGKTISNAARLAFNSGFGESVDANRRL